VHYLIALSSGLLFYAGHDIAWAQAASDKAAADVLFNEGRQLVTKPNDAAAWTTACEKFEASLSKLTQLGVQIALATCYEKLGKTASAWGAFRIAAKAASKAHDKRQRFAEDHATALEAKLSKIVITIAPANRVTGLKVKRDGSELTPAEFGSPVPVDPGEHTIDASAPGRVTWSTRASIPATPDIIDITVPALAEVPAPPAPRRSQRTLAYGLGGGGLAIVSVSLIFGAVANSKWNDAQQHCRDHMCDQTGIDLAGRARTMGNVSTGTFLVGAGAVMAGVILLLTAPSVSTENVQPANPAALHVVPGIGPAQVGLMIQGGF
jgi:serine/threonine-protein kinase